VRRGREPGHVDADLGDDHAGGDVPDAGDLIQTCRRGDERGDLGIDALVEVGDVGATPINAIEHLGQQERVVVAETAGERLLQVGDLAAHPAARELGEHLGVALPGDQRGQHVATGDP